MVSHWATTLYSVAIDLDLVDSMASGWRAALSANDLVRAKVPASGVGQRVAREGTARREEAITDAHKSARGDGQPSLGNAKSKRRCTVRAEISVCPSTWNIYSRMAMSSMPARGCASRKLGPAVPVTKKHTETIAAWQLGGPQAEEGAGPPYDVTIPPGFPVVSETILRELAVGPCNALQASAIRRCQRWLAIRSTCGCSLQRDEFRRVASRIRVTQCEPDGCRQLRCHVSTLRCRSASIARTVAIAGLGAGAR